MPEVTPPLEILLPAVVGVLALVACNVALRLGRRHGTPHPVHFIIGSLLTFGFSAHMLLASGDAVVGLWTTAIVLTITAGIMFAMYLAGRQAGKTPGA